MDTSVRSTLMLAAALIAWSATGHADDEGWRFEATPYMLAAGMKGDVGLKGVKSEVNMKFSDIAKNLDSGFMGMLVAEKGRWSFGAEAVYMQLEDDGANTVTGPFGKVKAKGAFDVTMEMTILQGSIGYRVLDCTTTVDLFGAARYTELDLDAKVKLNTVPGIVFPGGARQASGSEGWTDGVVGVRVLHPVSAHWSLAGYADVGAGGSDLTWQVIAGANWRFRDNMVAKMGYRVLYDDYKNGDKLYDMTASGPYLGLGIRF